MFPTNSHFWDVFLPRRRRRKRKEEKKDYLHLSFQDKDGTPFIGEMIMNKNPAESQTYVKIELQGTTIEEAVGATRQKLQQ